MHVATKVKQFLEVHMTCLFSVNLLASVFRIEPKLFGRLMEIECKG